MKLFISLAKTHKPREFVVHKDADYPAFKQYIRSEAELKSLLRSKLKQNTISLEGIIELYGRYNMALADNLRPHILIDELYAIREYDRDKFVKGFNGRKTKEEFEEHGKHIAKNGFKEEDFGVVTLRAKDNKVHALLTEGNNRVVLGKKHGIKKMPVMIFYSSY